MSVVSDTGSHPEAPGEVDTPMVGKAPRDVGAPHEVEVEEEVFEDASDAGEVFIRRVEPPYRPPGRNPLPPHLLPPQQTVSTPHIKPEDYDGTSDWSEYLIYFDQLAELYHWDGEMKAMILGVCLKGEARVVLASLSQAQRKSYTSLTTALAQSFAPKELVHLYQAELKARKKRSEESMVDLGREIAKLVRLAYPTADAATREVIGINSFLEALPGPAAEMKLHVIKGRPRNLQEAVAHATEVDAVIEAEHRRSSRKRGEARMVGAEGVEDEVKQLRVELAKAKEELKSARRDSGRSRGARRPLQDVVCYGCGEKGHYRRNCPAGPAGQGNGPRRLEEQ